MSYACQIWMRTSAVNRAPLSPYGVYPLGFHMPTDRGKSLTRDRDREDSASGYITQ